MKASVRLTFVMCAACFISVASFGQKLQSQASQNPQKVSGTNTFIRGSFIDTDKNGVCDNYEAGGRYGAGRNYVDKNGDGVCDNQGRNWKHGKGQGMRNQGGRGCHGARNGGNGLGCRYGQINDPSLRAE